MERILYALPIIECGLIALLLTAAVCLLIKPTRFHSKWLKVAAPVLGVLLIVPTAFSFLFLVTEIATSQLPRPIPSPDHKYVADYSYEPNFRGGLSTVQLRRNGSPFTSTILVYGDSDGWDDVSIRWLNNHELELSYDSTGRDTIRCETSAANVSVRCVDTSQSFRGEPAPSPYPAF